MARGISIDNSLSFQCNRFFISFNLFLRWSQCSGARGGGLMASSLDSGSSSPGSRPGARFSKAPESFRARKAIFKSSVSKNGEVHTLDTSCMKGTSLHL